MVRDLRMVKSGPTSVSGEQYEGSARPGQPGVGPRPGGENRTGGGGCPGDWGWRRRPIPSTLGATVGAMFTGIVEHVGRVAGVSPTGSGRRLLVDPCGWVVRPKVGDSIAVAGCCLTLAEPIGAQRLMAFDVVPETLGKTNLGEFVAGRRVNLEQAATAGTLLGGHVVQGHVDGVGEVQKNEKRNTTKHQVGRESSGEPSEGWVLQVRMSRELMAYMVPKGSVAIDGVSLTIAGVNVESPENGAIEIALIPITLAKTTLGGLKPGDAVNVEADVMAKTVVHYLRHFAAPGS